MVVVVLSIYIPGRDELGTAWIVSPTSSSCTVRGKAERPTVRGGGTDGTDRGLVSVVLWGDTHSVPQNTQTRALYVALPPNAQATSHCRSTRRPTTTTTITTTESNLGRRRKERRRRKEKEKKKKSPAGIKHN